MELNKIDKQTIGLIMFALLVVTFACIIGDPPTPEIELQECLDVCIENYDVGTEGHRLCTEECIAVYEKGK